MFLIYFVSYFLSVVSAYGSGCDPIQTNLLTPSVGQKSRSKCLEYQETLLFPCVGSTRENNCKHNDSMEVANTDAAQDEFPHMVMIGSGNDTHIMFFCGGTVISERFILTAAICKHYDLGEPNYVLVGALKGTYARFHPKQYDSDHLYAVKRIIRHPNYKAPSKYNDIALLETEKPIKLSSSVVPACLDTESQANTEVIGTGWGANSYGGSIADTLQKVKLIHFAESLCSEYYVPERGLRQGITDTHVCYVPAVIDRDMCAGNAGSPVQVKGIRCMYTVVGLTSFGSICGMEGEPSVYTRVSKYLPWIESIVWPQ